MQRLSDSVSGPLLERLSLTLRARPDHVKAAGVLPRGWHLALCIDGGMHDQLAEDGLPRENPMLPAMEGFPSRVMGATAMHFLKDIPLGAQLDCTARIGAVADKVGRSGPLRIMTIERQYFVSGELCIDEQQEVVYLPTPPNAAASIPSPAPAAPRAAPEVADVVSDRSIQLREIDVFRFSAVTFNSHRIHYDHPYATQVEGWPSLLVQAKYLALLLMGEAERHAGRAPARFSFRSLAPLTCPASIQLRIRAGREDGTLQVSAEDDSRSYLQATASF